MKPLKLVMSAFGPPAEGPNALITSFKGVIGLRPVLSEAAGR